MQHGMLITASQQTIWDYFKPVTRDNALCLACHKTLEKGTELTASMQAPNLKHHLKTVHPEIYVTYQLSLKQNKVSGCVQSARGERKKPRTKKKDPSDEVKDICNSCNKKTSGQTVETCPAWCEARSGESPVECAECGARLGQADRRLRRGGREWHLDCFQCRHCSVSLLGQSFSWREDRPYCLDCVTKLFSKSCQRCPQPIQPGGGRFISLDGRFWHNSCFLCSLCSTSLVDRGFIYRGYDVSCQECAGED